ncbi:MAG: RHS repeat-associated core domain-containing protein [Bacteroidales bacterium]|nr:RHS repeat-associated core domain-containing protein [Bacteroidales bacterium]
MTDYLGTPTQMFDEDGKNVWDAELDIYGIVRTFKGSSLNECPFRYQGQYEDSETGLYYNRFRYYDPEEGMYISQDPIGLTGNNPTLYGYVKDVNSWVDAFGLDVYVLTASSDGWYPVYKKGQVNPTSYERLNKGDTYKIGESKNSAKRYSTTALDEARINKSEAKSVAVDANGKVLQGQTAGLRMDLFDQGGTKQADRLLENQLLENYKKQNGGDLPAGNKTCH